MERPTHILVECPALIPSVRLGVLEPLKPLEQSGVCQVKFIETMRIRKCDIAWSDIFICVRGFEYSSLKVTEAAKKAGRYVIYFLDDDLLNIPGNISSSNYFADEEQKKSLVKIVEISDIFWCVNPLIAEKYSQYGNGKWIISKVPVELPVELNKEDEDDGHNDKVNVLYAGSVDHSRLIQEFISPVVKDLCEEFGDHLSFTFVGADPDLGDIRNVKHYSYFDNYDEYKRLLSSFKFHLGLAPIRNTPFYHCKYYNKFIEYTKLGAVGVYTNSLPYTNIIENGKNGLLCENTYEGWYEAIKIAVEDNELRERCVNAAENLLKSKFSPSKVAKELTENIPELIGFRARSIQREKIQLGDMILMFYFHRIKLLFRQHGVKAAPLIVYKSFRRIIRYLQK